MLKLILLALFFIPSQSEAACYCACVDGVKQNVCDAAYDLRQFCTGYCAVQPPIIRPYQPYTLPPLGTTLCRKEQVCDGFTCEWRTVCR